MFDPISNLIYFLLGIEAPGDEEGTSWSLRNSWQWAPWITVLIVLLLVVFVILIYWSEIGTARRRTKILLATIRFSLFIIVLGMIASWLLILQRNDLPYLLVFIDDSQSMSHIDALNDALENNSNEIPLLQESKKLGFSTSSRLNLAKTILLNGEYQTLKQLASRYKLRVFRLSENVEHLPQDGNTLAESIKNLQPTGKQTRIGDGIRSVLDEFQGNSIAAVVLLSDGITTEGSTLSEISRICRRKTIPIYTVALGSSVSKQDLALKDMIVDDVVFVGDTVRFQVTLDATGFSGRTVSLKLYAKNDPTKILSQLQVEINSNQFRQKVTLPYKPTNVEVVEFEIAAVAEKEETTTENNKVSQLITIKQSNIKILLVQSYPSYEFRFLKNMLQRELIRDSELSSGTTPSKNKLTTILQEADIEIVTQDKSAARIFPVSREKLFQYDVIIFGDVDPTMLSPAEMQNIYDFVVHRAGGIIFLSGPRFTPQAYKKHPLAKLMPIQFDSIQASDPEALFNTGFRIVPTEFGNSLPQMRLDNSPSESKIVWSTLPESYWALHVERLKEGSHVLAEHSSATDSNGKPLPLIILKYAGAGKVIFHCIDSTYRWRSRGGEKYFARYWIQTIRFLVRSQLLDPMRIAELRSYPLNNSGSNVRLRLRYFDPAKIPAKNIAVRVQLDRDGRKDQTLTFYPHPTLEGVYELKAMGLTVGKYHAQLISPVFEGTPPVTSFSVGKIEKEMQQQAVNTSELAGAAKETGGKYYQLGRDHYFAKKLLAELPIGQQVIKQQLPPYPIWRSWPIPLLFFTLIITEWIVRKRKGML